MNPRKKMTATIYEGERSSRATDTAFLEKRIQINHAYSSEDFDSWLFARLKVSTGEDVLDVGCGSGAQTVPFANAVGERGSVSALDISTESVALLQERLKDKRNVQAVAIDMARLPDVITNTFRVKKYDLTHSSYALYYSPARIRVLDTMRDALKLGGRCAIFTPNAPHGLVNLAARFIKIPQEVYNSLSFATEVLDPYFRKKFSAVEAHSFKNIVSLPSADVLIEFYRQTTYYDRAAEEAMREVAEKEIEKNGVYKYEKNGFLIIGHL